MNKITNKKDFKLLIVFFSMEAIILLICFLAAHFQVNKGASVKASWEYESFMNSTIPSIQTSWINHSEEMVSAVLQVSGRMKREFQALMIPIFFINITLLISLIKESLPT